MDDVKLTTTIKRHEGIHQPSWADWLATDALMMDQSPWDISDYKPRSEARLMVHGDNLLIRLAAFEPDEQQRRAVCQDTGGPVHLDSCLEAFISFNHGEEAPYFNFEFNSLGTAHIGFGHGRHERRVMSASEISGLRINCLIHINPEGEYEEGWWQIHFQIPASWLKLRVGHDICFDDGDKLLANFYKCGDETPKPHYLSWGHIGTSEPDFHRPEFFKPLVIRTVLDGVSDSSNGAD